MMRRRSFTFDKAAAHGEVLSLLKLEVRDKKCYLIKVELRGKRFSEEEKSHLFLLAILKKSIIFASSNYV